MTNDTEEQPAGDGAGAGDEGTDTGEDEHGAEGGDGATDADGGGGDPDGDAGGAEDPGEASGGGEPSQPQQLLDAMGDRISEVRRRVDEEDPASPDEEQFIEEGAADEDEPVDDTIAPPG